MFFFFTSNFLTDIKIYFQIYKEKNTKRKIKSKQHYQQKILEAESCHLCYEDVFYIEPPKLKNPWYHESHESRACIFS